MTAPSQLFTKHCIARHFVNKRNSIWFTETRSASLQKLSRAFAGSSPSNCGRHKPNKNIWLIKIAGWSIFGLWKFLLFNPSMTRSSRVTFWSEKAAKHTENKIFYGLVIKFYWHLNHQFINVSIYGDTFHLFPWHSKITGVESLSTFDCEQKGGVQSEKSHLSSAFCGENWKFNF